MKANSSVEESKLRGKNINIFRLIKKLLVFTKICWFLVFDQYNQLNWEPVFTRTKRVRLTQFSLVYIANAFARRNAKWNRSSDWLKRKTRTNAIFAFLWSHLIGAFVNAFADRKNAMEINAFCTRL